MRFLPRTPFPIVPTPLFVIAPSRWKGQTRPEIQVSCAGWLGADQRRAHNPDYLGRATSPLLPIIFRGIGVYRCMAAFQAAGVSAILTCRTIAAVPADKLVS